jgi:hypothetical protein
MRALALAFGLTLAATAVRADAPAQTPADPEARYQALLAAAKAAAPNADWTQLRIAYAERPSFRAFAQSGAKRQMFQATSDCKVALPAARAVIEEAYVDADAHLVAAFCEEAAGQHAAAQLDRDIGSGLIHSIQTGDGLSPASAFTPIDVDEEYALMRALGLKVREQAMIQKDGHAYDALTADNARGQRATYYFLIDRILAAERAALAPGAVSEGGPPSRTP